jgi:hypothetical protein
MILYIYVPALWFLCFWISRHHSLIGCGSPHPTHLYITHFFCLFSFLYMLSLFILQLKDFVHGNYWGWIYIHLLDLTRNSCEKMRLQVLGRNQMWGSGPFNSAALEPQGRKFHSWTYSCIFCSCSWLGLINVWMYVNLPWIISIYKILQILFNRVGY